MPDTRQMMAQSFESFHKTFMAAGPTSRGDGGPWTEAERLTIGKHRITESGNRLGSLKITPTSSRVRAPSTTSTYLSPGKDGQASAIIFDKSPAKPNEV